jgi:hypothetical protein
MEDRATCPSCGVEQHEDAQFCPQCGARLAADESGDVDLAVARSQRRIFGLAPPGVLAALAAILLAFAIVALATGRWIVGILLLAGAAALAWLAAWTVRRIPDARVAQLAIAAGDVARGHAGFARVSIASWGTAGWQVMRARALQRRLASQQRTLVNSLGEAVFRGDDERAEQLKAEAHACADRIRQNERELELALAAARERVSRERDAIQATERFAPGPPPGE